ncbi:hypothetical protein IWZ03DRAFT_193010 [Phyllosticta citriasiana]|uniref:Secreted protein n=1 Tax=Phyllosticta citriasiana TaxID=595635 RepID=A0ABR1KKG1_9PEZI
MLAWCCGVWCRSTFAGSILVCGPHSLYPSVCVQNPFMRARRGEQPHDSPDPCASRPGARRPGPSLSRRLPSMTPCATSTCQHPMYSSLLVSLTSSGVPFRRVMLNHLHPSPPLL